MLERILRMSLGRPFWAKRVDSGRRFARHFDEIRNDLVVDASKAGRAESEPEEPAVSGAEWADRVYRIVEYSAILTAVQPDPERRHGHDGLAAEWLRAGKAPADVVMDLSRMLEAERGPLAARPAPVDGTAANRLRLAEARAANGGHMFVGASEGGVR